jgi:hypothetical protein
MSELSNNQGRAYEFAYLITFEKEISKHRKVSVEKNSSYFSAERAWNTIDSDLQNIFIKSAFAGVQSIFELEPLILEKGK